MNNNFSAKLESISQSALDYIKETVKGEIMFVPHDELESGEVAKNIYDYDLPKVDDFTKYGFYDTYAIVSLNILNGTIFLYGLGMAEAEGEEKEFELELLSDKELCFLADLIESEISKK
jgi:hypothetical protein